MGLTVVPALALCPEDALLTTLPLVAHESPNERLPDGQRHALNSTGQSVSIS
jgi:hypothetical protein